MLFALLKVFLAMFPYARQDAKQAHSTALYVGLQFLATYSLHTNILHSKMMQEEYLKRGLDTSNGPEWYYFHLQRCFEPHKAANQCVIDHREQELRERRKRIREKKLGSSIHV